MPAYSSDTATEYVDPNAAADTATGQANTDTNNAAYGAGMGALNQGLATAGAGVQAADQSLSAQQQATTQALRNQRALAAKALASSQGSLGGGRGLAQMQQSAQTEGLTAGNLLAQAAQQRAGLLQQRGQAQQEQAATTFDINSKKAALIQQRASAQQNIQNIVKNMQDYLDNNLSWYSGTGTRNKIAADLRQQYIGPSSDAATVAAVNAFIQNHVYNVS